MIHVIATVEVASGKRDEFLAAFRSNVPLVRDEDGCLEYAPAIDADSGISAQGAPRDDVVTVVEKWRDLAALEVHLGAPHMQAYREKVKDLVKSVKLQILQPV